jgi:hypothetical protein
MPEKVNQFPSLENSTLGRKKGRKKERKKKTNKDKTPWCPCRCGCRCRHEKEINIKPNTAHDVAKHSKAP